MQIIETVKINREDIDIPLKEILRYSGYRKHAPNEVFEKEAYEIKEYMSRVIEPKACMLKTQVRIRDDECDFKVISFKSRDLARLLKGCINAYFFAVTTGIDVDRKITLRARNSASYGMLTDAAGSAAIEAVCDKVCERLVQKEGCNLTKRFSPGYGDLSIEHQKDFIRILDTPRKIGLSLTRGGMLVPVKSVTAIVGMIKESE